MKQSLTIDSPIGSLTVVATESAVTGIHFNNAAHHNATTGGVALATHRSAPGSADTSAPGSTLLLRQAATELAEYFAGQRRTFDFPTAPSGTLFQQAVWEALCTIPYGETRSYSQIAAQIGRPRACRAVGMANNRNPIAIVIPCHRVIGHAGALTGYAGGLDTKQRLLDLETER